MLEVARSPADVLLAGLQGEHVAGAPFGVGGAAHQAAGHLADVLLLAAEQAQVGAAEGWRNAQGLPLARNDVGAELAGRFQHPHGQRVSGHDQQRAIGVGRFTQRLKVFQRAVEVGVLGHDAGRWPR